MKRIWNEQSAMACILANGAEKVKTNGKFLLVSNGLTGLKACSAMDYLKSLGYKFIVCVASKTNPIRRQRKTA